MSMTIQQRRTHWLEASRKAKLVMNLADNAQEVEVGDRGKHEHESIVKAMAEAAALKALLEDLKLDLEL